MMIALVLLAAEPARADELEDQQIFMCLAAMGGATEADDQWLAEDAYIGHVFWLGRIDPAMSADRMDELAMQASEALNRNNIRSTLDRCGGEMNRMNDQFGETITRLQKQGKAR